MSGAIELSRLAIKLGIPHFKRNGHRAALEALRARVAAFQPNDAARDLDAKLVGGLDELYKAGDSDFRKATIDNAEKVIVEAEAGLRKLEQARRNQEEQRKKAAPNADARKAMQAKRERLTAALDAVLVKISTDAGKVQLPEAMRPAALRGRGEVIRTTITAGDPDDAVAGGTRAEVIARDIEGLRQTIAVMNARVAQDYSFIGTDAPAALKPFQELLAQFDAAAGGKGKYVGPLAGVVGGLQQQLRGSPVDAESVRRQLAACDRIATAASRDPQYGAETQSEAVADRNGVEIRKWFDARAEALNSHFEKLREASEQTYAALSAELQALRDEAGAPIATDAMPGQRDNLQQKLNTLLIKTAEEQANVGRQITVTAQLLQKELRDEKVRRDRLHDTELKDIGALTADWKAIDAQIGSATELVPLTGLPPVPLGAKDVKIVGGLLSEINKRLEVIEKDKARLLALQSNLEEVSGYLAQRSYFQRLTKVSREKLEKYDPDKRAAFQKRLDALAKAMATTPAASTLAVLDKLKTEIEAAVADLAVIADYVEKELPQALETLRTDLEKHFGEHVFTTNNDAHDALEAVDTLVKKQPPDKAAIEALVAKARATLQMSPKELADKYKADKAAKESQKSEDARKQADYNDRLRPLKGTFSACEQAVKAVSGDQNSLGTCQRLMNDIQAAIEANSFDGLDKKMEGLKDRMALLLRNPLGEANRRASELPKVFESLRHAFTEAASGLQATAETITAQGAQSGVDSKTAETVARMLNEFAVLFTANLPKIEQAIKPLSDPPRFGEEARRAAREAALALTGALDTRLRGQPLTKALLTSPFPQAKAAIGPVYRSMEQFSYTVSTSV